MTMSDGINPSPNWGGGRSRLGPPLNPPLALMCFVGLVWDWQVNKSSYM